ncbi:hypothetical protein KGF56_004032 [Candida oxycetoniae]|uniref:Calnexin n=1 Tax=Candida oxycetoniae TaxID=497107 RepID=A0AAI9WWP0_9ASCO|nr:uncharacterized protein KGF56_004032 [Candida oxycetoniae]KAI3403143.2 hypothetical protein KGF56_004032 [Candida oxycetoniae]
MKAIEVAVVAVIKLFLVASTVTCSSNVYQPFDQSQLGNESFFEQFDYLSISQSPWKSSHSKKYDQGRDEVMKYNGIWSIEKAYKYPGFDNDLGLVMKSRASYHAIACKLPHTINNDNGKVLVIQYEVKAQVEWSCTGAYIKLLDEKSDYSFFNDQTPFQIAFGPDKCGSVNRVYFEITRSSLNGSVERKVLQEPPLARLNELTNLYTLILHPNQDFEIRINGKTAKTGNFLDEKHLFHPPIFEPGELVDESEGKPLDWDTREYISDPSAKMPDDYEQKHAHPRIADPNAVKPKEWDESEPRYIPDPTAVKPVDDAGDDWMPSLVVNPKCGTTGCGLWVPPTIINPDYRGPWIAPLVKNPNYKGPWTPEKKIAIPNSSEKDKLVTNCLDKPIGGIGFELWTMDGETMFDNIYLGNSISEAELIGNQTFKPKFALEYANKLNNTPKVLNEPILPPPSFDDIIRDDSISNLRQFIMFIKWFLWKEYMEFKDFVFDFFIDPVRIIMRHPFKASVYAICLIVAFTFLCGIGSVLLFLLQSNGSDGDSLDEEDNVMENRSHPHSDDGDDIVVKMYESYNEGNEQSEE